MGRDRVLSEEGLKLFNVAVMEKQPQRGCVKSLLYKLFTSEFDINLDESSVQMRKASMKLYSFLSNLDSKSIPQLIDNAIVNIILLILLTDNKINKLQRVKYNIHYYTHLAKKAHDEGDHHTAILIKAALENTAIRRLKLKTNKSEKRILQLLEKSYGTFMNCNSQHLQNILAANTSKLDKFLPSIMVLLMHINKTREYAKSYKQMGYVSDKLISVADQLKNIRDNYYHYYKQNTYDIDLIELYLRNPLDNTIMAAQPSKGICAKLYDISHKIQPVSSDKTLKRTKKSYNLTINNDINV